MMKKAYIKPVVDLEFEESWDMNCSSHKDWHEDNEELNPGAGPGTGEGTGTDTQNPDLSKGFGGFIFDLD